MFTTKIFYNLFTTHSPILGLKMANNNTMEIVHLNHMKRNLIRNRHPFWLFGTHCIQYEFDLLWVFKYELNSRMSSRNLIKFLIIYNAFSYIVSILYVGK